MTLENVTKEIVQSADVTIAEINSASGTEIAALKAETDATVRDVREKGEKKLAETLESLRRQEVSSADLESKKVVLSKQKEIMAEAFESALAELNSLTKAKRVAQYKKMVESAKGVIDSPIVLVSESETVTASDIGVKTVKKDPRVSGGLIFQSQDGTVEVDMQYSTILQSIWDRELKTVSDILFG